MTPCPHGITLFRWEKWWYRSDGPRVPRFSSTQHNWVCVQQWKRNHTDNCGPFACEPQRQPRWLFGWVSDHSNVFKSMDTPRHLPPVPAPGSTSAENAILEYAMKIPMYNCWRKEICWVSLVDKSLCAVNTHGDQWPVQLTTHYFPAWIQEQVEQVVSKSASLAKGDYLYLQATLLTPCQ